MYATNNNLKEEGTWVTGMPCEADDTASSLDSAISSDLSKKRKWYYFFIGPISNFIWNTSWRYKLGMLFVVLGSIGIAVINGGGFSELLKQLFGLVEFLPGLYVAVILMGLISFIANIYIGKHPVPEIFESLLNSCKGFSGVETAVFCGFSLFAVCAGATVGLMAFHFMWISVPVLFGVPGLNIGIGIVLGIAFGVFTAFLYMKSIRDFVGNVHKAGGFRKFFRNKFDAIFGTDLRDEHGKLLVGKVLKGVLKIAAALLLFAVVVWGVLAINNMACGTLIQIFQSFFPGADMAVIQAIGATVSLGIATVGELFFALGSSIETVLKWFPKKGEVPNKAVGEKVPSEGVDGKVSSEGCDQTLPDKATILEKAIYYGTKIWRKFLTVCRFTWATGQGAVGFVGMSPGQCADGLSALFQGTVSFVVQIISWVAGFFVNWSEMDEGLSSKPACSQRETVAILKEDQRNATPTTGLTSKSGQTYAGNRSARSAGMFGRSGTLCTPVSHPAPNAPASMLGTSLQSTK